MRSITTRITTLVSVLLLATACVHSPRADEKEMSELSAALTKVSAAVHVTVRYETPVPALQDAALLNLATAQTPSLLDRLEGYVLKARQLGRNSSILVCKDDIAYIEDAGCTGELDGPLWSTQPGQACDYVLDLAAICP